METCTDSASISTIRQESSIVGGRRDAAEVVDENLDSAVPNLDYTVPNLDSNAHIPLGLDYVDHRQDIGSASRVLSASSLFVPATRENRFVIQDKQPEVRRIPTYFPAVTPTEDPSDLNPSNGFVTAKPKHKRYSTVHARLLTYHNKWDQNKKQTPEQLSKAGFFFVGREDGVKCFFCNIGLKNWQKDDFPWLEHARWAPKCGYLRQSRGCFFINTVQKLHVVKQANLNNSKIRFMLRDVLPSEDNSGAAETFSPAVESVLCMGYSMLDIKRAISVLRHVTAKKDTGDLTAAEILTVLLEREGEVINDFEEDSYVDDIITDNSTNGERSQQTSNTALLCTICMENPCSILFAPCSHLVTCAECAFAFDNCPICRKLITGTLRVQRECEDIDFSQD